MPGLGTPAGMGPLVQPPGAVTLVPKSHRVPALLTSASAGITGVEARVATRAPSRAALPAAL